MADRTKPWGPDNDLLERTEAEIVTNELSRYVKQALRVEIRGLSRKELKGKDSMMYLVRGFKSKKGDDVYMKLAERATTKEIIGTKSPHFGVQFFRIKKWEVGNTIAVLDKVEDLEELEGIAFYDESEWVSVANMRELTDETLPKVAEMAYQLAMVKAWFEVYNEFTYDEATNMVSRKPTSSESENKQTNSKGKQNAEVGTLASGANATTQNDETGAEDPDTTQATGTRGTTHAAFIELYPHFEGYDDAQIWRAFCADSGRFDVSKSAVTNEIAMGWYDVWGITASSTLPTGEDIQKWAAEQQQHKEAGRSVNIQMTSAYTLWCYPLFPPGVQVESEVFFHGFPMEEERIRREKGRVYLGDILLRDPKTVAKADYQNLGRFWAEFAPEFAEEMRKSYREHGSEQ